MNHACTEFVFSLTKLSPGLEKIHKETLDYWSPEEPPLTTLYGDLGDRIVDDLDILCAEVIQEIMSLVEQGMCSDDVSLKTAVATGLIEAVITRAASYGDGKVEQVLIHLGPQSKKYAEVWMKS